MSRSRLGRLPLWVKILIGLLLFGAAIAPPAWYVYQSRWGAKKQAANHRTLAHYFIRRGKYARAEQELRTALEHQPDNAEIHLELGRVYLAQRNRAEARKAFERALELDPESVEPQLRLGLMALDERDLEEAKRRLQWLEAPARTARVRPYAEAVAMLRYRVAYIERDLPAAHAAAERALDANPRSLAAALALARVALVEGDISLARKTLESSLTSVENKTPIRVELSRVLERTGLVEQAAKVLDDIAADDQLQPAVLQRRGELAFSRGDRKALARLIEQAEAGEAPAATREYLRGLAALLRADRPGAEAAFRRALAASPLMTRARLELAKVLVAANELGAARTELETILVDDPMSREALVQLARLAFLQGRYEESARKAEQLLKSSPQDLETTRLLVAARSRQGRPQLAVRFFDELLKKDPRNPVAKMGRSMAWLAAADLDKAVEGTEQLLTESPEVRGALELLSAAYAAQRGLASALDRLRLFMARDPRFVPIRFRLANVYAGIGRHDLARQELESILEVDPDYAPAHLGLASLAELDGDYDRAIRECQAFLQAEPDSSAGRALLARVLRAAGEPERALEVAERPWSKPALGMARYYRLQLARIGFASAVEVGSLERAARQLQIARAIDPTVPPDLLAAAAVALGRFREAQHAIAPVIAPLEDQREAVSPVSRWLAAIIALARGRVPRAVSQARLSSPAGSIARSVVYVNALLLDGKRKQAQFAAAQAAGAKDVEERGGLGPMARAIRQYAAHVDPRVVARTATPLHRLLVCTAYEFRAPVRPLVEETLSASEGDLLIGLLCARALQQVGEQARALRLLRDMVRRYPKSIAALEACGTALVDAGEYAEAAQLLERAAALAPDEPRVRVFAGLAREQLGDRTQAIEAYRSALQIDPESVVAHNRLAGLLVADSANIDQALKLALRAQQLAPGDGKVLDTLGLVQLRRDKLAEALAALAKARKADPGEPSIRLHLAQAYYRTGQTERALAELNMAVLLGPDTKAGLEAAAMRDKLLDELSGGRRPGASFATAGRLHAGDLIEESLGARGNHHVFRLDLRWAQRLVLRYTAPTDAATTIVIRSHGDADSEEGADGATHDAAVDADTGRLVKQTSVPAGYDLVWPLTLRKGVYAIDIVASGGTSLANYVLSLDPDDSPHRPSDHEPNDTVADAEPLALGAAATGRLGPLTDVDCYALPAEPGTVFDLAVSTTSSAQLSLRLLEPGDFGITLLKSYALAPSSTAVVPAVRPTAAGLVVEISSPEGVESEYVVRTVARTLPTATATPLWFEPDDLPAAAQPLVMPPSDGRVLASTGTIEPRGDRDLFRPPPRPIRLEVHAPTTTAVLWEAVLPRANGRLEVLRTSTVEAGHTLVIPAFGVPGVLVSLQGANADEHGTAPYILRWSRPREGVDIEPNDTPRRGIRLEPGTRHRGWLDCAEDRDIYVLPPRRDSAWRLQVHADTPLVVALLEIPPGGRGAARARRRIAVPAGRDLTIDQWLPGTGIGAIEISAQGASGAYTVLGQTRKRDATEEAEPNNHADTATTLRLGEPSTGALDSPDDRDVFTLELPADAEHVTLRVETLEGPPPRVTVTEGDIELAERRTEIEPAERIERKLETSAGARLYIVLEPADEKTPCRYRVQLAR